MASDCIQYYDCKYRRPFKKSRLYFRPRVLTTAIDFDNTEADIEIAKSVAKDFRLSKEQAETIERIHKQTTNIAAIEWKKAIADIVNQTTSLSDDDQLTQLMEFTDWG